MATVYLSPIGNGQVSLASNALPANGGFINTYAAGTTTPVATYTTSGGTITNANPIVLGVGGLPPSEIWLIAGQAYKFVITDSLGTQIGPPYDNLSGIGDPAFVGGGLASLTGRNAIYNGNFDAAVNAGPIALTTTPTVATVDLWYVFQNTSAAGISAQVTSDIVGFRNYLKLGRNAASALTNPIGAQSAIKTLDSIPLQAKNVVLSFYAKAGANFSGLNLNIAIFTGTGINENPATMSSWTGVQTPLGTTQILTTTGVQYAYTCTLASTATEIGVRFFYTPVGTAGADDNVYITGVSLQLGLVPSPQDIVPYRERIYVYRPDAPAHDYFGNLGGSSPFSQCQLVPRRGNLLLINGNLEVIPPGTLSVSGGVQATYASCSVDKVLAQTLAINTLYYVYAYMLNGVMTLDFSTSSQIVDPATGVFVKYLSGTTVDPTCTLVGLLRTNGSSQTIGDAKNQTIISWNNRLRYILLVSVSGNTTSATFVELNSANRLTWVQWSDDLPIGATAYCNCTATANGQGQIGIGLNSTTTSTGFAGLGRSLAGGDIPATIIARMTNPGNDGYNFASLLALNNSGGTTTVLGGSIMVIDHNAV